EMEAPSVSTPRGSFLAGAGDPVDSAAPARSRPYATEGGLQNLAAGRQVRVVPVQHGRSRMAQQLGDVGVGNAVGEGVSGESMAVAVADRPVDARLTAGGDHRLDQGIS